MRKFGQHLRSHAKRSVLLLLIAVLVDFAIRLLEHRILAAVNDFIDEHSASILKAVQPSTNWLVQNPSVLFWLTLCGIMIHAYVRSLSEMHEPEQSSDPPPLQAQTTTVSQEASPTTTVSPVISANPTITANPTVTANPKIIIHNNPPQTRPPSQRRIPPPDVTHNVSFAGARRITTDLERQVFDGDGLTGIIACFLNQSIPDRRVSDLSSARARVVVRDSLGSTVAQTSLPKWLNHDTNQFVDVAINTEECILLAIYGKDNKWYMPCLMQAPAGYWDDGSSGLIIDAQPLPHGTLEFEITLVSADNGLGLHPVTARVSFGPDGNVMIERQNSPSKGLDSV
jgi:hypothetical protein